MLDLIAKCNSRFIDWNGLVFGWNWACAKWTRECLRFGLERSIDPVYKFPVLFHRKFLIIVNWSGNLFFTRHFLFGFMEFPDNLVFENLVNCDTSSWIEDKYLFQQVYIRRIKILQCGQCIGTCRNLHFLYEGTWHFRFQGSNVLFRRVSCETADLFELVHGAASSKQGFLRQNLIDYAAEAPDVCRSRIRPWS